MNNLKLACIEYNKQWLESLPENPPEFQFSRRHNRKMKVIFDKMRGNRYHYFTRKTMVVMITAAMLFTMSLCAFANPDFRAYILDELSDHAIFQSLFESKENVDGKIDCGYIPDGFEVTTESYGSNHCYITFENSNGLHFSINKMKNGDEIGLDNEDTQKIIIESDGKEFIIYEKNDGSLRLVWCDENYTYRIVGNITTQDALFVAENIK